MGLYGMTSGQALGQGTFTFDRIVPNRYLLDSRVNNDSVMPGRYALIEYDRPVAVVSDINNFTYEEGSKAYDIIPVKDGVIDMTDGSVDCIFICTIDSDNNNLYQYYYYNFSDSNSSITSYESPMTPNEFNKIVDEAYIAKDTVDDIDLNTFELWDSTAWIKVIDKEKSEFKYIKIADLNVLTPSFKVLTNSEEDQNIIGLIDTFSSYDNTQTKPIAIFNVPQIKQAENGIFNIRYPNPMDINIAIDTSSDLTGNTVDSVSSQYIDKNTKKFTLNLPSIGNAVIDANTAAEYANTKAEYANTKAEYANTAADKANAAAEAADEAREGLNGSIVNSIGTKNLTVSIGGETSLSGGKLNIETTINSDRIITAAIINNLWNPQETQEGN